MAGCNEFAFLKASRIYRECADELVSLIEQKDPSPGSERAAESGTADEDDRCARCGALKVANCDCPSEEPFDIERRRRIAAETQVAIINATKTQAERTVASIAMMLGWGNVPPQATLEMNLSALKARLKAAEARADALQQQVDEAMKVLDPNMPESGLVDACRQVKQVAISEADNSNWCEQQLAERTTENETLKHRLAEIEDIPLARLQLPDGGVPGNTAECAQGWYNAYRELLRRQRGHPPSPPPEAR